MRSVLVFLGVVACGSDESSDPCDLDDSPFLHAECLADMRDACNQHETQNACGQAERRSFDSGHTFGCAWVQVVTIADEATCAVESTKGRCEAVVEQLGCLDTCTAIPSEGEILDVCGGPIGPWSEIDSEDVHLRSCSPNVEPTAPPLCACASTICSQ